MKNCNSLFIFRRITHSFKEGEEFRKDEDIHKWELYLKMTFEYGHIYESIYMNNESQVFGLSTDQLGHAKAPGFYWGALQSKVHVNHRNKLYYIVNISFFAG